MYKILPTIACQILPLLMFAQGKNDYVWVMGYGGNDQVNHFGGTQIDFSSGSAKASFFPLPYHFGFDVPCSISDEEGRLQFYSNGCQVFNADNEMLENGDGLSPNELNECDEPPYGFDGYQNMLILPRPGHSGRYVYIHHTIDRSYTLGSILYSEIDMNANNGKGKVIEKNKTLRDFVALEGAMTSVRHGNGRDWWIVIPQEYYNIYNIYLLTPDTLMGPFAQNWENHIAASPYKTGWNVVFSPDGRKFARVTLTWEEKSRYNRIFLYDFDRCSGTLCNPKVIKLVDPDAYASWATFSPNSRFLYVQIAQNKLYQYDLQAPDIDASAQLIGEYDGFKDPKGFSAAFHAMALAPDNKIYMCTTSGTYFLHTIHSPDELGLACDFQQHDLEIPTVKGDVMPNYPNYRLYDVSGSLCDTLGIDSPYPSVSDTASKPRVRLTPNPASLMVNVFLEGPPTSGRIRVFGMLGQLVFEQDISGAINTTCFSVENWASGTYVVAVEQPGLDRWTGKLVVVRIR